ncbi:MAG: peptide deformylase [Candidatus Ancillula sp.]|jgi:peptide deformylase|nr:peptide deformylase [Candidatus Ancillula sp.]
MSFKFDPKRIDRSLTQKVETLLKEFETNGVLRITQVGESVLRQPCNEFKGFLAPDLLRKLIHAMKVTMHKAPGVGLAAPQIDLGIQLAVIEDTSVDESWDPIAEDDAHETRHTPFFVIINPTYEPVENSDGDVVETLFYEGCLSFHNYYAARFRYHTIKAYWTDEKGRDHEEVLSGWPARIFQHETDHLSGEIYIDKAIIRSLSTASNLSKYDLDADIEHTAKQMGFEL